MYRLIMKSAFIIAAAAFPLVAEENKPAADESAIRKAVENYVASYNRGDAKALAALWSPEAVYLNPLTGAEAVGREEIAKQFAEIFAQSQGAKLEARTDAVRFVSPNVAVEQGTATVIRPDEAPEQSEYSAVYVKRDGEWLLDRVTELETPEIPSHYDHLKELEWMIGTWVDQDGSGRIQTECQWTKNRNFITRSFAISIQDRIELSGMQIVGWDPHQKQIRSWIFDSDGGFGEGVWSKKGSHWYIHTTSTLPDGRKSSAVNIITCVDDNCFKWQSVDRVVDGQLLPNVDEVAVMRQSED